MKEKRRKKNILLNIVVVLVFLLLTSSGFCLITIATNDLSNLKTSEPETKEGDTLEELEEQLEIAKANIKAKKEEINQEIDAKQVECDRLHQICIAAFFKTPNGDKYYEAQRNETKCQQEKVSLKGQLFILESEVSFPTGEEVQALIEDKKSIEEKIKAIKNPTPQNEHLRKKEFNWPKFLAISKLVAGVLIIMIPILLVIAIYNRIVKSETLVNNTFANIDVYLKKRWDLLPNLMESVKGYSAYEASTLTDITRLRQRANYGQMDINAKVSLNNEIDGKMAYIFLLTENYPELKANSHYLDLSNQLSIIENEIASSRVRFNAAVMRYNNALKVFPNNLVASFLDNIEMSMFNITEAEKQNINVNLAS